MSPVVEAVLVYLVYLAVVAGIWRWKRIDYMKLAESKGTIRDGIVLPIGAGLGVLVVATTILGWWGRVFDQPRIGPAWALVAPIAVALTAAVSIAGIDRGSPGVSKLRTLAVGVLFVGMAEELLTRGLLVVGARQAGWSPVAVFVLSTGLFGLLHGINGFFGLGPAKAATQVVLAAIAGTAFFVTRMSTGSLVLCMVLHAAWDFGGLGQLATDATAKPQQVGLTLAAYAAGLIAIWPIIL